MDIYLRKQRWKWFLLSAAVLIIFATFLYTNRIIRIVGEEERDNVRIWADAIHRKASLVNYTESFFEQIAEEERRRVEMLANAYKRIIDAEDDSELSFSLSFIDNNKNIPVVITDEDRKILWAINVDFSMDTVKYLNNKLLAEFARYRPIVINYYKDKNQYLYYKDSKLFSGLKEVLDDLTQSFFDEVAFNTASVPVIITDSLGTKVYASGNMPDKNLNDPAVLKEVLADMRSENEPIIIRLTGQGERYIYYQNSGLLTELRLYPYVQFSIIGIFLLVAYFLFSTARKAEQNQVWVGMSKETAHQLGTPLSSMMAWIELLKMGDENKEQALVELGKDISRLEVITERFSKIGSIPELRLENLNHVLTETVDYFKTRTSRKIKFHNLMPDETIEVPLNKPLFNWVIENLFKNAIDAMNGAGDIRIKMKTEGRLVQIDISDTGKGISRRRFNTIFNPGFTSKKRGWGLGLSLARRIIVEYHHGKIFVKSSALNEGTTFRITLYKSKLSILQRNKKINLPFLICISYIC